MAAKIIDFNEACEVRKTKVEVIPSGSERAGLKTWHKHIDPALYDGLYVPWSTSDVYSFGYMASTIAKTKKSELIDKLSLTCMSKYKQLAFETLVRDLHPLTPKILLVILLTVCHIVLVMLVWRIWYSIN